MRCPISGCNNERVKSWGYCKEHEKKYQSVKKRASGESKGKYKCKACGKPVRLKGYCDSFCMSAHVDNLERKLEAVLAVARESNGIVGWHKNGDVASWEEILPELFEESE